MCITSTIFSFLDGVTKKEAPHLSTPSSSSLSATTTPSSGPTLRGDVFATPQNPSRGGQTAPAKLMQQDRNGKTTKSCSVPKSHPGKEQTVPENSTLTRPSIGSNRVTSSGQGHPLATSSSANCPKTSAGQNPTKFSAQSSSNCPKNVSKGQLHVPPRSNTPPPSVTMPTLDNNSSLTPPTSLPSEPPPSSITTTIDKNTPSSSVTKTQQSSEEARKLRQAQQKLQKEKWQKKFSSSNSSGGSVGVKVGVKRCSEGSLISEGSSGGTTSDGGRGQNVMDGFAVNELISDGELS